MSKKIKIRLSKADFDRFKEMAKGHPRTYLEERIPELINRSPEEQLDFASYCLTKRGVNTSFEQLREYYKEYFGE